MQTLEAAEHVAVLSGPEQRRWATAVRVARADVLLKSGDAESAAAVATDAVEEEPDNPLLMLLQGEDVDEAGRTTARERADDRIAAGQGLAAKLALTYFLCEDCLLSLPLCSRLLRQASSRLSPSLSRTKQNWQTLVVEDFLDANPQRDRSVT